MTAVVGAALLLGACSVRSISNSGYGGESGTTNAFYRGELKEADVIGVPPDTPVTEAEIAAALKGGGQALPQPRRSLPLMVVQSGAVVPDDLMLQALRRGFTVESFSGVPPANTDDYARRLRLMAAQGGYRQLLCYWGALEAERSGSATKLVSWVPIVGAIIPDERQRMRLRLKALLVDVETGRWRAYAPAPVDDTAISTPLTREDSDQDQVAQLKAKAYEALADDLIRAAVP
ncbi:aminopeptidase [Zavarzinia compransoris]|nr:aminopeptidase [Zavarzinia compransoris]